MEVIQYRWFFDLEFVGFRSCGERSERSNGVFQIQHLGIVVVLIVHGAQVGVVVQHGFFRFNSVVLDQFSGDTQPYAVFESAEFTLGIGGQLFGYWLGFSGLDVQLSFKDVGSAEGTDTGLVALDCGQIIRTGRFQKFTYFLHENTSLI